jgi:hypothetical protein
MATQPVLQGNTLAWPKAEGGYQERYAQRAASLETANGNYVFQRITTAAKREFTLSWAAITAAQLSTIRTAYDALLSTGGSSNFTAPTGSTYTVTPLRDNPPLDIEYVHTPDGGRYNVAMQLREVSST